MAEVEPNFKTYAPKKPRKGLNKVGRKAKREQAALDEFRALVKERAEGLCEARIHPKCPGVGTDAHHKCISDRRRGIHDPERGMWLCGWCHTDWIHKYPAEAYARGWLIREQTA